MLSTCIEPFDYVEKSSSYLGVVRGAMRDTPGSVAIRRAYERTSSGWNKIRVFRAEPAFVSHAVEADCTLARSDSVDKIWKWNSVSWRDVEDMPQPLRDALASLSDCGAEIYLSGSRLLDVATDSSDWDFCVVFNGDLAANLHRATSALDGQRLSNADIREITAAYRYPASMISQQDLEYIQRFCRPSIRLNHTLVDLFVRRTPIASIPDRLSLECDQVYGALLANQGRSYAMPREIAVDTQAGPQIVRHTGWGLVGFEHLAGQRIRIDNLGRSSDGELWFSPRASRLTLQGA